eukprot:6418992-Prymnesium_polylepis.1
MLLQPLGRAHSRYARRHPTPRNEGRQPAPRRPLRPLPAPRTPSNPRPALLDSPRNFQTDPTC